MRLIFFFSGGHRHRQNFGRSGGGGKNYLTQCIQPVLHLQPSGSNDKRYRTSQTHSQGVQDAPGSGGLALCPIRIRSPALNSDLTITSWNKGRTQEGGSTRQCHSPALGRQRCVW